jgi:hypothetical protein
VPYERRCSLSLIQDCHQKVHVKMSDASGKSCESIILPSPRRHVSPTCMQRCLHLALKTRSGHYEQQKTQKRNYHYPAYILAIGTPPPSNTSNRIIMTKATVTYRTGIATYTQSLHTYYAITVHVPKTLVYPNPGIYFLSLSLSLSRPQKGRLCPDIRPPPVCGSIFLPHLRL